MELNRERFLGSLTGLAIGDALGTTVEFTTPGGFQPVQDMVGGGVFQLNPGEWTDDTSMALCLAESLIETNGFDPVHQMQRYSKWRREGYLSSTGTCFDIGNATAEAIRRFERTGEGYCGSTKPNSAGNGSIMRLCPVPLFYASDPEQAIHFSALSSRTTHAAEECIDACRLMAAYLLAGVHGWSKERILNPSAFDNWLDPQSLSPRIADILAGSYKRKEPPEIQGSGYVVKSLEAALWAFDRTDNFETGALKAVNLGDDADTTGAVYGQIAGAYYGVNGIPKKWRDKLAMGSLIKDMADEIYLSATN
ncbi:ADP-ribosylglycohydrolase family protein [Cohnella lubricantis]|uniref:ADP-ribosylglycohydrolase family protein n=1 Tax=Cohnella lubricantis TaxID=2163172 RepID=A0A841T2K1_9BACL|nr:ADP-ribosylglycohydrolase family protein [Cohnella lubricantis]MBB6675803.1 ADP-ribosylglycohydrolase family protein [Cohnella lubricantis]MBP2119883.1 ADP-ribosylglycohydrolase [Cohnella lubricantis]